MNEDIVSIYELKRVTSESAEAYAQAHAELLKHVLDQLKANPDINKLISNNSFELVLNKSNRHASFMATVFRSNTFELLVCTMRGEYRAYTSRGFSHDFFLAELQAWHDAVDVCLECPSQKTEIQAIYSWLIRHLKDIIELTSNEECLESSVQTEFHEIQQRFLTLLLRGDSAECLKLADQTIVTTADLKRFYLDVICPSMYRIGQLWESNQVTLSEEHLATVIVSQVMTSQYPRIIQFNVTRGKSVVCLSANEFHELGARMVADFMEMAGWDVHFIGKSTSVDELVDELKRQKPFILAISVATAFNLKALQQVIQLVRDSQEIRDIKIIVGGSAFIGMPNLWKQIGADGYAADAEGAILCINSWWSVRSEET